MNQKLSQDRANSVKTYMLNGGTPESQIASCTGYGKQRWLDQGLPDQTNDASHRRTRVIDA